MSRAAQFARLLQRGAFHSYLRSFERRFTQTSNVGYLLGGATVFAAAAAAAAAVCTNHENETRMRSTVKCEDYFHDIEHHDDYPTGYTESERFFQSLEYHRALLHDYHRRWKEASEAVSKGETKPAATEAPSSNKPNKHTLTWPRKIPKSSEVPALKLDLTFCERSPNYLDLVKQCQDIRFRIASFCVTQEDDPESQWRGYRMIKDLAERGHPDGMCLYGR